MFMVLCVIDDPGKVDEVLEALEAGGVTGATIMESTGLHRKRDKSIPRCTISTPALSRSRPTTLRFSPSSRMQPWPKNAARLSKAS